MTREQEPFEADLDDLQPSQLYISSDKLAEVERSLRQGTGSPVEPLPVRSLARISHGYARFRTDLAGDIFVSARRRPEGVDSCALLDLASRCLAQNSLSRGRRSTSVHKSSSNRRFSHGHARPHEKPGLGGRTVLTDGHTRAVAAGLRGEESILVRWDEDDLDWEAYEICVKWCLEEGVRSVADLSQRVVTGEEYETLWLERCRAMHRKLAAQRA